jgi:hypothetical protein
MTQRTDAPRSSSALATADPSRPFAPVTTIVAPS